MLYGLKGRWWKPGEGKGIAVDVIVRGFAQATISDSSGTRPVAIVQELGEDQRLRYVELKFVEIQEGAYDVR